MVASPHTAPPADHQFAAALVDFLRRQDAGDDVDRVVFSAEFPEVAERLWDFFEAAEEVEEEISGRATGAGVLPSEFPYRFGDYLLTEEIGAGGRGVVYKARQLSLDRIVAVKVIRTGRLAGAVDAARFQGDARLPAQLNHPNIVAVHEIDRHDGLAFFSMEYVEGQSLAQLVCDGPLEPNRAAGYVLTAAEAIESCHRLGTLHRDLKPSNVMIDGGDRVRIIDFGFAKRVEDDADHTATGELVGTVRYMSTEQALGHKDQIGPASDVYSLGAILYELLAGRPPFSGETTLDTLRMVVEREPPTLRTSERNVPRDLETICLKCLAKEPAGRYATAQALADDLQRFLRHEPIRARRPSVLGRVWRWRRRQPGWAAALAATSFAFTAIVFGVIGYLIVSRDAADSQAAAARQRVALLRIQQLRTAPHRDGWSDVAWKMAEEAVAAGAAGDGELQTQVASTLMGLDARLAQRFEHLGARRLALDAPSKRLLVGGVQGDDGTASNTRLVDLQTWQVTELAVGGTGPIGFHADGTPWQMANDEVGPRLVNLHSGQTIRHLLLNADLSVNSPPAWAALSDGSLLSALARRNGRLVRLVWNGATGELLHELSAPPIDEHDQFTNRAEFSPDGSLLAEGDTEGNVHVWSMTTGEPLRVLKNGRSTVHCVAFARDTRRSSEADASNESSDWLLATGDAGGAVTVWDLVQNTPRTRCLGSQHDVFTLAFSPDRSILASAGRDTVRLWDVASGRQLLKSGYADFASGVAFTEDGSRLIVATRNASYPGNVAVWDLQYGRGIRAFRGLHGFVSKLTMSRDGRSIAALSHRWEVGVWDAVAGQLRHVLQVPSGFYVDNASLAFSPDGGRLAFSSGAYATLWDVTTGELLERWELPDGLCDSLAYAANDRLLLFRVETEDGRTRPDSSTSFTEHPRVCRIRNLLSDEPRESIGRIDVFNRLVHAALASPDGRFFVVEGLGGADGLTRTLAVFDRHGREQFSIPTTFTERYSTIALDPPGKLLVVLTKDDPGETGRGVYDLASGRRMMSHDRLPTCVSPGVRLLAERRHTEGDEYQIALFRSGSSRPLVTFECDGTPAAAFSPDGELLAWGNADGQVFLCDIEQTRTRLAKVKLGW